MDMQARVSLSEMQQYRETIGEEYWPVRLLEFRDPLYTNGI